MIRGVNKQIIEINNTGNKYFERAILFVRPEMMDADDQKLHYEARKMSIEIGKPPSQKNFPKRKARHFKKKVKSRLIHILAIVIPVILTAVVCYLLLR